MRQSYSRGEVRLRVVYPLRRLAKERSNVRDEGLVAGCSKFLFTQNWRVPGGSLGVRSYMGLVRRVVKGRSGRMKLKASGRIEPTLRTAERENLYWVNFVSGVRNGGSVD